MVGVGHCCPNYDQLKPVGIQEMTSDEFRRFIRTRALTSGDKGVVKTALELFAVMCRTTGKLSHAPWAVKGPGAFPVFPEN